MATDQSRADQHRIVVLSAVELCRRFVNTIDYRPKNPRGSCGGV